MQRFILSIALLLLAGCATGISLDRDELSEAKAAIEAARVAGAEKCAPDELSDAQVALYQAAHELSENVHTDEPAELMDKAKKRAGDALEKTRHCGPKPKPKPKPKPEIISLPGVHFEYDSAKLTRKSMFILNGAVRTLKAHPRIRAEVAAYTDSRGSDSYNQRLSQRRAQSVLDYLVAKGVTANHLSPKGYGESDPVADNTTDEGRAKNRRVELRILSR